MPQGTLMLWASLRSFFTEGAAALAAAFAGELDDIGESAEAAGAGCTMEVCLVAAPAAPDFGGLLAPPPPPQPLSSTPRAVAAAAALASRVEDVITPHSPTLVPGVNVSQSVGVFRVRSEFAQPALDEGDDLLECLALGKRG
jgi:hypothetical protein